MKIFFARHGIYENPDEDTPCRLPGFPLSPRGVEQIALTSHKLLNQNIRAIFTSPIERCVQTATIISTHLHLFPNQRDALIEVSSPYQGKKATELPISLYEDSFHVSGGGEIAEIIFTRMNNFIDTLKHTSKNSNYLIVSHGDPMMIFLRRVLKKEVRYIPMGGLVMLDFSQTGTPKYQEII